MDKGSRLPFLRTFIVSLSRGRDGTALYTFDLLDQGTDTLGLLQRVLDHFLQMIPFLLGVAEQMTVLLQFLHIDQQRGERPIQQARDGLARLTAGTAGRLARRERVGISELIAGFAAPQ